MWRASSIYCLVAGVFFGMLLYSFDGDYLESVKNFSVWYLQFLAAVYVIIRVYMIAEVFLSLRALPRSAFESVQWSSFLPHI